MRNDPPKYSQWVLGRFLNRYNQASALGDLEEEFEFLIEDSGCRRARRWYRRQVVKSIPYFFDNIIYGSFAMLRNYIKIAFRNLKRQKIYSIITLSGLVLGLGVFIMFALIPEFLSSFDTFHEKADRIFSVVQVFQGGREGEQHSAITPAPLSPTLLSEFPEIEDVTRFFPPGRMIVKYQDKVFYENGIRFVDPNFLSVFSFQMIMGNADIALSEPYSIVLTESSAMKYFGDENPVGKTLTLNNLIDVVVTGVTKNVPGNSSIRYEFLVSMSATNVLYSWMDDWKVKNQVSFLLLSEGVEPAVLESKLPAFVDKHYPVSQDSPKRLYLFPLLDFFLKSSEIDNYWSNGQFSAPVIWIVAVLLLIVACINFMNLSTARFAIRANEVGVRKVIGARRSQLIRQFLGESILMCILSLPVAILFYEAIRPAIRASLGDIVDISIWEYPQLLILVIGMTILTGIFAGSYPAFYLSAFKPAQILKENRQSGKKGGRLRKILVVFQFSISIILMVITIVSIKQSEYNLKVDLGYDRHQVLAIEIDDKLRDNVEVLKNGFAKHQDIVAVSASTAIPIEWETIRPVRPEGVSEDDAFEMNVYGVDYDFVEMLDLQMVQGRPFSRNGNDSKNYILNETALDQLQLKEPIGEQLTLGDQEGTVIGVAKDFHFKSILFTHISPALLYLESENLNYVLVKYSSADRIDGVLEHIEEQWKMIAPDMPFEYVTLDDVFREVYVESDKTSEMTGAIGLLAILMSCMGLFGLSSFAVERRIKEIGIRKVLGASITGIVRMLIKDFIKWVVIANIIAMPIAYLLMNRIIRFFYAYPMNIGPGVFMLTLLITVFIAFITVTSQTLRAAQANPIETLKYE